MLEILHHVPRDFHFQKLLKTTVSRGVELGRDRFGKPLGKLGKKKKIKKAATAPLPDREAEVGAREVVKKSATQ